VLPLLPAPMVPHAGTAPNAGERQAAKRWLGKRRQAHPHRKLSVTADSRRSHAPPLQELPEHPVHESVGVTPGDHAAWGEQVAAAEHAGRVTSYARAAPETGRRHRLGCVRDVPRKASQADLQGPFLACWEWAGDQGQPGSGGTALRVNKGTVEQSMRGGRARWRSDQETCHTLNNPGDPCAHNDGHGSHHLSGVVAVLMLRALGVDQVQQLCCPLCQAVWAKRGSKRRRWERMSALCSDDARDSRRPVFEALW
jgi:hypothetical protein